MGMDVAAIALEDDIGMFLRISFVLIPEVFDEALLPVSLVFNVDFCFGRHC